MDTSIAIVFLSVQERRVRATCSFRFCPYLAIAVSSMWDPTCPQAQREPASASVPAPVPAMPVDTLQADLEKHLEQA